jgi:hypothetical protein
MQDQLRKRYGSISRLLNVGRMRHDARRFLCTLACANELYQPTARFQPHDIYAYQDAGRNPKDIFDDGFRPNTDIRRGELGTGKLPYVITPGRAGSTHHAGTIGNGRPLHVSQRRDHRVRGAVAQHGPRLRLRLLSCPERAFRNGGYWAAGTVTHARRPVQATLG